MFHVYAMNLCAFHEVLEIFGWFRMLSAFVSVEEMAIMFIGSVGVILRGWRVMPLGFDTQASLCVYLLIWLLMIRLRNLP